MVTWLHKPGNPVINPSTLEQMGVVSGGRLKPQTAKQAKVVFGGIVAAEGCNKSGITYWIHTSTLSNYALFGTAQYIYNASSKYDWNGQLISSISIGAAARGFTVDSSGNIYVCHVLESGENVRKYNSAGVKQWGINTGGNAYGLALSYNELHIGVGGTTDAWSLNASNGSEEWEYNATTDIENNIHGVCFDASGNMYIGTFASRIYARLTKIDSSGNQVWIKGVHTIATGDYDIYSLVADNNEGYIYGACEGTGNIARVFKSAITDGTKIWIVGIAGWNNGRQVALDTSGRLFAAREGGSEIDKTNGSAIWAIGITERATVACAGITSVPAWADLTVYVVGDIVTHNDTIYECILGHTAGDDLDEPGVGANWTTYWIAV